AELAMMPGFDSAAELPRHGLLAVTAPENTHTGREGHHRRRRRIPVENGGRPAGPDHRPRLHRKHGGLRLREGPDFRIDALLPHAPRDQLRDLGAKIDD